MLHLIPKALKHLHHFLPQNPSSWSISFLWSSQLNLVVSLQFQASWSLVDYLNSNPKLPSPKTLNSWFFPCDDRVEEQAHMKLLLVPWSWKYHNISLIFERNKFWKIDEEEKRDRGVGVERRERKNLSQNLEWERIGESEIFWCQNQINILSRAIIKLPLS